MFIERILQIFEDDFYVRQYGIKFLKLLHQYLTFKNAPNVGAVDKLLWRRLLASCQRVFEKNCDSSKSIALQCVLVVLELGTEQSYLVDALIDYVPFVESLFVDKSNWQTEAIRISLILCKNVCKHSRVDAVTHSEALSISAAQCQLSIQNVPVYGKYIWSCDEGFQN